jgi:chemotaxis protein methyltransferase CheR
VTSLVGSIERPSRLAPQAHTGPGVPAMTLSSQSFTAVTNFFFGRSGIRLGPDKHALVQGRLQRLATEAGQGDINHYVRSVLAGSDGAELTRVVDRLTTNETYFFREPQHFQFLGNLLSEPRSGKPLRVWSAASSSGEEAYSISMVLHDRIKGACPWEVIGTDLSTQVVDTARTGLYPIDRAEGIPEYYRNRFCMRGRGDYEGKMLMSKELRQRVKFMTANLLEPLPDVGMFDVIFLRNVLIYFDVPTKTEIVNRVIRQLNPGGFLLSGHSESLANLNVPLRTVQTAVYTQA